MTSQYITRDAVIVPLKTLLAAALEHQALFETGEAKLGGLTMPCAPAKRRRAPLRSYRPAVRERLLAAGESGYATLLMPLTRLFAIVPPLLSDRPLRINATFTKWEASDDPGVLLPVEIGAVAAQVGGANFMGASPGVLAKQLTHYLAEHEGMAMEDDLHPWTFDVPELAEHVQPYQGLLADSAQNAITRLGSLSAIVREFLRDGGRIDAARADIDEAPADAPSPRKRRGPPSGTSLRS